MSISSLHTTYTPSREKPRPAAKPGEFVFAAAHLDHGHISGQTNGLLEAGGTLKYVFEPNAQKRKAFLEKFQHTGVKIASRIEDILEDKEIHLVASAAIPSERGPLGCRVMKAGKDYFADKSPFTTLSQLEEAQKTAKETGRKYMVYYSERIHVESAWYVDELIQGGAIGQLVHMSIMGPHRLNKASRPKWFFEKKKYGGILTDIGSHQFDQFLHYARATDGKVAHARVENFANTDVPELEDYGEAVLELNTGTSCMARADWFTPDGLKAWSDGRTFFIGTKGYIEIRKSTDLGRDTIGNLILIADGQKEEIIECKGKIGFPFFGELILDSLNRTEQAMTQAHAFKAAELSMKAQEMADAKRGE